MFTVEEIKDSSVLKELVDASGIDEEFNYEADIYHVGIKDGKIVGVIVYVLEQFNNGEYVPRFIHVIFDESIKRSKNIVILLIKSQRMLASLGYKQMFCLIEDRKQQMITYAKKFGFEEWNTTEHGKYLYKNIGE